MTSLQSLFYTISVLVQELSVLRFLLIYTLPCVICWGLSPVCCVSWSPKWLTQAGFRQGEVMVMEVRMNGSLSSPVPSLKHMFLNDCTALHLQRTDLKCLLAKWLGRSMGRGSGDRPPEGMIRINFFAKIWISCWESLSVNVIHGSVLSSVVFTQTKRWEALLSGEESFLYRSASWLIGKYQDWTEN